MARLALDGGGNIRKPAPQNADRAYDDSIDSTIRNPLPTSKDDKEKKEVSRVTNSDGTITITWSDGSVTTEGTPTQIKDPNEGKAGYYFNPATGKWEVKVTTSTDQATTDLIKSLQEQILTLTNSQTKLATEAKLIKDAETLASRKSIMDVLVDRFTKVGLGSLANKIKELAIDGATEATITLALQDTDEYKVRFKANDARIKSNLSVLTPAEYLNLEDGYRQVLRAYGLTTFDTDEYVQQFIANDMSAAELSNRVVTAVQRVKNADPAVAKQLRDYYGIGAGDLVAYVLDPKQQFQKIERQVAASEIGVAAGRQGLRAGVGVAEQLASQGITQAEAQRGYSTIADILPTASKLSEIYGTTLDTYGQSEGEQEVFNSLASAQRKRERLSAAERGTFSGSSGLNKSSLSSSSNI